MSENFNPDDYASFDELPEEQRINYEPLEGGSSFVCATVERNPETAHRLAIVEDRAINTLNQTLGEANSTFEEVLEKYLEYCKNWDFDAKKETLETLKQFSDIDALKGIEYNPAFVEACKKSYTEPTYSKKLQEIYLEEIDSTDLEVVAYLLKDKKFSQKKELIGVVNEEDIAGLYELVKSDLSAVKEIVVNISDSQLKLEIFKGAVSPVEITDEADTNNPILKQINEMRSSVTKTLVDSGDYDSAIGLVREGYLEAKNFTYHLHRIESDQFLSDLAKASTTSEEVIGILRFIADETLLAEIVESKGADFPKIEDKETIVKYASKLHKSLISDPEVFQADRLTGQNKFIFGIPSDQDQVFIGWSNTGSHGYHKDIFNSMSRRFGLEFPNRLRSGGYIKISSADEQGMVKVTFCDSSGDFGNYSKRIMEKFQDQIVEALKKHLNTENIELEIDTSR